MGHWGRGRGFPRPGQLWGKHTLSVPGSSLRQTSQPHTQQLPGASPLLPFHKRTGASPPSKYSVGAHLESCRPSGRAQLLYEAAWMVWISELRGDTNCGSVLLCCGISLPASAVLTAVRNSLFKLKMGFCLRRRISRESRTDSCTIKHGFLLDGEEACLPWSAPLVIWASEMRLLANGR